MATDLTEDEKWTRIRDFIRGEMNHAIETIGAREQQIGMRALELANRLSGTMEAHLKHHDAMEDQAQKDREKLRDSVGKVHARINQIAFAVFMVLIAMLASLIINGRPWDGV